MNLVEELGIDRFNERLQSSLFLDPEGQVGSVSRALRENKVVYSRIRKDGDNIIEQPGLEVEWDFFDNIGKMGVPNMGWRSADNGKYMAYYKRHDRSYHRGSSLRHNIEKEWAAHTRFLKMYSDQVDSVWDGDTHTAWLLFNPEFINFTEGVEKMKKGEIMGFAASPSIAVIPHTRGRLSVMFRNHKIGEVMPDNTLVSDSPFLSSFVGAN